MNTRFIQAFDNAINHYSNPQQYNRNYKLSVFSSLRHSFKLTDHLSHLRLLLTQQSSEPDCRETIKQFFKKAKFNNHSFASYLLDELIKLDTAHAAEWELYDPKPILYYQNTNPLYRGMCLTKEIAHQLFKEGMECKQGDLAEYASIHSWSIGISTSTCYWSAMMYAAPPTTSAEEDRWFQGEGYIFEIDPSKLPQQSAIDILKTLDERSTRAAKKSTISKIGNFFARALASPDQEVNVCQNIPADAIVKLHQIDRVTREIVQTFSKSSEKKRDIQEPRDDTKRLGST